MAVFVFNQPIGQRQAVAQLQYRRQRHPQPHLFIQTAAGGGSALFRRHGVAAAGVAPKTAAVVFLPRALLQQQLAVGVKQVNGHRVVQRAFTVGLQFFHSAHRPVPFIDQDDFR